MIFRLMDLDVFFISYDEPGANLNFLGLSQIAPRAPHWVHGIKGFHAAHEHCALNSTTDRFITVDGDNQVDPSLFYQVIDDQDEHDLVFSFRARNELNGLEYGNGSVKVWPRQLVLDHPTHEAASDRSSTDFCWKYRYMQVDHLASYVDCCASPYQAFRSGYREAVKLSLVGGEKLASWADTLKRIDRWNLSRLRVWMSVGADVRNGIHAVYGARHGFCDLWEDKINPSDINDYDWFEMHYMANGWNGHLDYMDTDVRLTKLDLDPTVLNPLESKWFKTAYVNPQRIGLMTPDVPKIELGPYV